ncbi:ABC transporter permease [Anaerovorax odorimutans]|uniref:Transport permease protein n=1 Tax=Anaerovorax odorimutans TaxID=109327 RepID=A0ABT1RT31_9FIRM|nr:ABC transporter permease [Anaerovorax odorimutans]MCQ4638296.1 ABC transporter permease [Anaerovorax odorimutans]
MQVFAGRTTKEILRDPISMIFGIGFPVILILLLTAINRNVPEPIFQLDRLTPGIAVFGLSFMALFSAQLVAHDRETSMLARLMTTPMSAADFILGYTLPLIPMALAQSLICYLVAFALGMEITVSAFVSLLLMLPVSLTFIGMGLLCGSLFNEKTATGVCGALLTNLTAWLSGTWFSLDLVGGAFKTAAYCLPFVHAVDMGQAAVTGAYGDMFPHIWWVAAYGIGLVTLSMAVFRSKMKTA